MGEIQITANLNLSDFKRVLSEGIALQYIVGVISHLNFKRFKTKSKLWANKKTPIGQMTGAELQGAI